MILSVNILTFCLGFEKPVFAYIEKRVVWITFPKGENASLYVCCNALFIARSSCKGVSICPQNKTITDCETRKQKVRCEIPHVQNGATMRGYLGRFDGKKVVQLSDVATFVTNKSGMKNIFCNKLSWFVSKLLENDIF